MVHGRWSYIRISEMILYFFYKNMIFTIPQVVYCFYNAFSGQSIFDDWYISFYNLAFTSIPLVVRAVFDQDLYYKKWIGRKKSTELIPVTPLQQNYPFLYYVGQKGNLFTTRNLLRWISHGVFFGVGIFIVILGSVCYTSVNIRGNTADIWFYSIVLYTSIIFMVDLKLALYTKTWTWMNWLGIIVFSVVIYIGFIWLGDILYFFNSFKTAKSVFSSWHFLLTVFWSSVMIYAFDMILLILDKELYTPLSTFFLSILRRRKEHEELIFERIVEVFKENQGEHVNEANTVRDKDGNQLLSNRK